MKDFEPVPNQEFDAGRIIDITECIDKGCNLDKCDYMNCKNYCVEMRQRKISIEDFFNNHKEELIELNRDNLYNSEFSNDYCFEINDDLIYDLFEEVEFNFPKNIYYSIDNGDSPQEIILIYSDMEKEVDEGVVRIEDGKITEYEFADETFVLACRIRNALRTLKVSTYAAIE